MLIADRRGNALGGRALLYYLIPYSAMSVGAFAVVAARERELGEPVTLDEPRRLRLGAAVARLLDVRRSCSASPGFPLTGGFVGKFYVFSAAYEARLELARDRRRRRDAVSLYYYLAVIRAMYMRPAAELGLAPIGGSPPREIMLSSAGVACAMVVNVGSFFAVQPLVDFARSAADSLPL